MPFGARNPLRDPVPGHRRCATVALGWEGDLLSSCGLRAFSEIDPGIVVIPSSWREHRWQAETTAWSRERRRENDPWLALDDDDWLFEPKHPNLLLVDSQIGSDVKAEECLRELDRC